MNINKFHKMARSQPIFYNNFLRIFFLFKLHCEFFFFAFCTQKQAKTEISSNYILKPTSDIFMHNNGHINYVYFSNFFFGL